MDCRTSSIDQFGLLNIAKPAGLTSRKIVSRVQRMVRPAKAGHAGTLDPLATGVLLVCVGRATRLVPLIHELHKVYRATFLLGRTSDTDDVEGTVVARPGAFHPERQQVLAALPEFVGRIEQRPPAHSAIKVAGRRAYALARKGEEVELAPRRVDVYRIDVLRYEYPELALEIECGTGTYVRSIGRDLGERLGCGAVMSALQRTAIGPFRVEGAVEIDQLRRETLPGLRGTRCFRGRCLQSGLERRPGCCAAAGLLRGMKHLQQVGIDVLGGRRHCCEHLCAAAS